jgi:hypothetical protein
MIFILLVESCVFLTKKNGRLPEIKKTIQVIQHLRARSPARHHVPLLSDLGVVT